MGSEISMKLKNKAKEPRSFLGTYLQDLMTQNFFWNMTV